MNELLLVITAMERQRLGISLRDIKKSKAEDGIQRTTSLKWIWTGYNERVKDYFWNTEIGK